jgi:hypothetical protein
METIEINEAVLKDAAGTDMGTFIQAFTDRYRQVLGGELNADNMALLNGSQHTLLAYDTFRREVLEGGFCQLIQNGYGAYIFDNPFAKAMRLWGAVEFSKLVYKAKKIYDDNKDDLVKERTEDEFMAMYEQFEQFDDLDDTYIEEEEKITEVIARYVDEHIDEFAKIVK